MESTTIAWSLAGGALIGLSASLLLLFNGRVAGISGMVGGPLSRQPGPALWRPLFITWLLLVPSLRERGDLSDDRVNEVARLS